VAHGIHIPAAFIRLREKMKYGPVVPHIIIAMTGELDCSDVSLDPGDRSRARAETLPRKLKCSSSNIKDCHVLVTLREKFIHESGSPPAHINDLSRLAGSCTMDQF
jgi:hypothetical protein